MELALGLLWQSFNSFRGFRGFKGFRGLRAGKRQAWTLKGWQTAGLDAQKKPKKPLLFVALGCLLAWTALRRNHGRGLGVVVAEFQQF